MAAKHAHSWERTADPVRGPAHNPILVYRCAGCARYGYRRPKKGKRIRRYRQTPSNLVGSELTAMPAGWTAQELAERSEAGDMSDMIDDYEASYDDDE